MRKSTVSLVRGLSVLLATATLLASPVTLAQSRKPFKATIATSEMRQSAGNPACVVLRQIAGTGDATDVGKVTVASIDCLNPDPINTMVLWFSSHQVVLTTANGDQIFATYGGTLTTQGAAGAINGGWQITGGTGRFSQATGQGIVQGLENLSVSPAQGEVEFTG